MDETRDELKTLELDILNKLRYKRSDLATLLTEEGRGRDVAHRIAEIRSDILLLRRTLPRGHRRLAIWFAVLVLAGAGAAVFAPAAPTGAPPWFAAPAAVLAACAALVRIWIPAVPALVLVVSGVLVAQGRMRRTLAKALLLALCTLATAWIVACGLSAALAAVLPSLRGA